MKFTHKTGYDFDRGTVVGHNFTGDSFPRMSAAIFTLHGSCQKMKSLNSDRLYYILNGKASFIVKSKKQLVKSGELVIIPMNTPYSYSGDMECFLVHSPAFDKTKEIKL
jgi:mannose-6-phosphate isomerase-like protein (cupin superfamily)